jgi:DNA-binding GntR family transcriptional regulator
MLPWPVNDSSALFSGIRDTSLGKLVRDEMLGLILRGELAAGQRINEPDVAARLRVSRVPVREALRELESSGLVAARKHSGVFVRVLDPKEVADLYELRTALDGYAGHRAARLGDAKRRALVRKLGASMREMKTSARKHNVQSYYASNLAFHWDIVAAAENEQLTLAYRRLVQQLHLSRLKNLSRDVGMQASMVEHEEIVAALVEGDAERCRSLQEVHVSTAYKRLVEIENEAASAPASIG